MPKTLPAKSKSSLPSLVKIGQAARIIGVSIDTIRRWEAKGKIIPIRTPGGTRLYSIEVLAKINPKAGRQTDYKTESSTENQQSNYYSAREKDDEINTNTKVQTQDLLFSENIPQDTQTISWERTEKLWSDPETENIINSPLSPTPNLTKPLYAVYSLLTFILISTLITSALAVSYFGLPESQAKEIANLALTRPFNGVAKEFIKLTSPQKALKLGFTDNSPEKLTNFSESDVLAISSIAIDEKYLQINADLNIVGGVAVEGEGIFLENLTAPNIIYSVIAGDGIEITAGQNPTISATDTLATVTARGSTTDVPLTFGGGATLGNLLTIASLSSDPTSPINGSIYYNTTSNSFRCYQNGTWRDCDTDTTGGSGDITGVSAGDGLSGGATSGDATLTVSLTTTGTTGLVSSNSGMEVSTSGLTLLKGCTDGETLLWDELNSIWECGTTAGSGDITAVGSMTSGATFADATADDDWLGLGAAAGRIEFDDQAIDEVNILGANVGIGDNTPSSLLEVGDGTDSIQFSAVGDITFVDADGASSITGSTGGTFSINSGAGQALTLDSATDINLDADGADTILLDGGVEYGRFTNNATALEINSAGALILADTTINLSGGTTNFQVSGTNELTLASTGLTITDTLSVQGNSIGLNDDASVNNVISFGAGPGQPTGDLYWGSRLLCTAASVNCGWANGGTSPFTSTGGIIDKTDVTDRLRLLYGDAGDVQMEIQNTTNGVVPTTDAMQINLAGGAGVSTDGVDGLSINIEGTDGTANTVTALHLNFDTDSTAPPTGDETFVGLDIDALNTATSASEYGIRIGNTWDAQLFFNDTTSIIKLVDASTLTFEDAAGNDMLVLADVSTANNHVLTGDADTGLVLSGITTVTASSLSTLTTAASLAMAATTSLTLGNSVSITNGSGNITLQPAGAGTTAVVQIGAGGAGSTTPDFLGIDVKSDTGDPAGGAEGYIYYNTADNKFRCFENAAWIDCITAAGATVTLQSAYNAGNTITTTDGRNIVLTFADTVTDQSLTLTQQGTVASLILNDTNGATNTAFTIQSAGTPTLTINELGTLSTSGNISTTGTGTITSAGLLTASNGLTLTTGALNLTATSGALTLSGLGASSISTGANNITFTSGNFNTTATGINGTAIGATTPSSGAFTTLSSTGTSNIGSGTGAVTIDGTSLALQTTGAGSDITINAVDQIILTDFTTCTSLETIANVLTCGTDDTGATATLQTAYDAGNTITTTTGRNLVITLADVATPTSFTIENQDTAGVSAEWIFNSIATGTLTNGLLIEQTGAGTMTNAIQIAETAGTITDGILITGTLGNILNSGSIDITGAGAITGATGVSTTTLTATGDVTMNDAGADNILIGAAADTVTIVSDTLSLTDNNWNITAGGAANFVSIGAVTPGSGAFTTLTSTGASNIGSGTGAVTIDGTTLALQTTGAGSDITINAVDQIILTDFANCSALETVSNVLTCGTDDTGTTATLQTAYDAGNTITTTTGRNIIVTLADVATPTSFTLENQDTAGVNAERIFNSIATGTLTNGLLIEQTGAGTMTNAIQIAETTGTITDGILITGTLGNILNSGSIDITGAGAITGATGVSTTTLTSTGTSNIGSGTGAVTIDGTSLALQTTGAGSDITINAVDQIILTDFANCSALETVSNVLTCGTDDTGATAAFTSAGGIIDKTDPTDRLRLLYGDVGDVQLEINNTTNAAGAPTADVVQLNITNGAGITTDNVDGLYINIEAANGTSTDVSALHLDLDTITGSADDTFSALLIDSIAGTSAIEYAINIGNAWDANLFLNDTTANIMLVDASTLTFEDAGGNDMLVLADVSTSNNHVLTGDSDTGFVLSGITTLTASSLSTFTTAATLAMAATTTLNCGDCIDFDDMEDTLDLDTNLILNQTTSTWTQNFTGDTTVGLTYNANSLTTGTALNISSSGTIATTGELVNLAANTLTSGAVMRLSATAMTSGTGFEFTGPSAGTAGITGNVLSLTSDLGAAGELINLSGTVDSASGTSMGINLALTNSSSAAVSDYGYFIDLNDSSAFANDPRGFYADVDLTGNAAKTGYGGFFDIASTSTTADTTYGVYSTTAHTGAISTGAKTVYGVRSVASSAGAADTGGTTKTYGVHAVATGEASGTTATSTTYGVYASASGADNNYAGIFDAGVVGVGETTPDTGFKLELGGHIGPNTAPVLTSYTQCTGTACRADGTSDAVGEYTSIAIGADGFPIVAYYDSTNTALKVYKCADTNCSTGSAYTVDNTGDDGAWASIAIAPDGLPVISYCEGTSCKTNNSTSDILKMTKCGNAACSAGNTITTVRSAADATHDQMGHHTSIAIGTDGLPVIAYADLLDGQSEATFDPTGLADGRLYVTKCGNSTCSSGNTNTTVNSINGPQRFISIVVAPDGFPFISFYAAYSTDQDLLTVKCGNTACSAGNTTTTVEISNGAYDSTTIGTDGLPIIVSRVLAGDDLAFSKCLTATCSSDTSSTPETGNSVGHYTSIALGRDGLPIAVHYDSTNGNLRTFKCTNIICSAGTATAVDTTNDVGLWTSIAIGNDGLPVISFFDDTNDDLRIIKCATVSCNSSTGTAVAGGINLGSYSSPFESLNTTQIVNPSTSQDLNFVVGDSIKLAIGTDGASEFTSAVALSSQKTLTVDSTTPSVAGSSNWITANAGATLISNFTNGTSGQLLAIEVADNNTGFDCTGSNLACGAADLTTTLVDSGDFIYFIYDGTNWNLINFVEVTDTQTGADLAEHYISTETLEPGDLVSIDASESARIHKSQGTYDQKTIGIVSTQPGIILKDGPATESTYPIALAGRVPLKVTTENGPIEIGDQLTASSIPGVAMKATRPGQIVGKALAPYSGEDIGTVMTFVNVTFADPGNFLASLSFDSEGNLIVPKIKTNQLLLSYSSTYNANLETDGGSITSGAGEVLAESTTGTYVDLTGKIASLEDRLATLEAYNQQFTINNSESSESEASTSGELVQTILSLEQNESTSAAELDLTPPDSLLASTSATLTDLVVTDTFSSEGLTKTLDLTVSGIFKALGETFLGNTTVAGDLTVDGTLSLNGDSINVLGTLFLQNNPLAQTVDIFNGLVKINNSGDLTAQTVTASKFQGLNDKNIGSGKILAGTNSVEILSQQVDADSKILITPTSQTATPLIVLNKVNGQKFTVSTNTLPTEDITFDWFLISSEISQPE